MRFRNTGWTNKEGTVITHSTVDDEEGEPLTAITFRSSDYRLDIITVTRPFPNSRDGSTDSANTAEW